MNSAICVIIIIYLSIVAALVLGTHYVAFFAFAICFCVFSLYAWQRIISTHDHQLNGSKWLTENSPNKGFPLFCFSIIAFLSAIYWLAYFPGGFNLDADGQWMQSHGLMPYNDWHPIMSTLLVQFVLSIVNRFEFYILCQIILFSLAATSVLTTLRDQGVKQEILYFIAFYIGINPAIGLNTICMTKDAQFTVLLTLLTAFSLRILCSRGKWLESWVNIVLLGLVSGLALLVRHNGMLYVMPFFVILMLSYRPRIIRSLCACMLAFAVMFIVKDPVFQSLRVEPHENVVGEAIGIPMGIMANALIYEPDNIPDEVHVFLNDIAPDSEWEKLYLTGEWDSCKWEFGGPDLLKGVPLSRILALTWKTIIACPQASFASLRQNTRIVWDPVKTNEYWIPEEYIAPNDYGIDSRPVLWLHSTFEFMKQLSMVPVLSNVLWNTGFQIIAILLLFFFGYKRIKTENVILFIPLLAYDFGTMLLLAGPNQRYFYCNAVLFFPIMVALLLGVQEGSPLNETTDSNSWSRACRINGGTRNSRQVQR